MRGDGRWILPLLRFEDGVLVTAAAFAVAARPGEISVVLLLTASVDLASAIAVGAVQLPSHEVGLGIETDGAQQVCKNPQCGQTTSNGHCVMVNEVARGV